MARGRRRSLHRCEPRQRLIDTARPPPSTPNYIVLTTINEPTPALERVLASLDPAWGVVAVGDAATPPLWSSWPVEFLSPERQRELHGAFAAAAPTNRYCRKNFEYLYALQRSAACILEIAADGSPCRSFATPLTRVVRADRRQVSARARSGADRAMV